ncbi:transglycosylase SLT domain-containing protein [Beggiatoa leptomitoformis]|uniref:Transglycosylase SLT domain-containing protein n=1 Tax=Beggiatoa leptomitoformis TaxID=288004 RepID=A0A2N9YB74_9GAMM|nr:transglycosylase SLT domain-containing protein [Beggiatoa leptomitoformis]ALG66909.1 transglycosylase SLT domain-containing protein [Beggiatoa leptomitoformis]AUI67728.1 transglycosylase SLT domain-containing protein [Beggiatoa leptomitoformis]
MKRSFLISLFLPSVMLFIGLNSITVHATDITQQRQAFLTALQALKSRNMATFEQLSTQLDNYPLNYYLRYLELSPRLKNASPEEILAFVERYGDTANGNKIRQEWLARLAAQNEWAGFLYSYKPQKSQALQCNYLYAQLMTGTPPAKLMAETKELYLVSKAQPSACEPLFAAVLYNSKEMQNNALLWQRIHLVMQAGNIKVADTLSNRLNDSEKQWLRLWQTMHLNPSATLSSFSQADVPLARDIIVHGISRLATDPSTFNSALSYWDDFQKRYAFSVEQLGEAQRNIALASAKQDRSDALQRLTAVNKNYLTDEITETRLKLALKRQEWVAIADFVTELPIEERDSLQWQYWLARALEQINGKTNEGQTAKDIYQHLAKERDYYGFLAADRLGIPYDVKHHPIQFSAAEEKHLMNQVGFYSAYEFYQLGMIPEARREWQYVTDNMPQREQAIAAALASRWKWYDRAIFTAAKANSYDDLEVRFPLAYYQNIVTGAKNQDVDLSWVYGITRQESAFVQEARSGAGALGLMQLMPATGRHVAQKIGLPVKSNADILYIDNNIALGAAYLKQMLDFFDGNYMLATAAYNAGPGRAKRWAAMNGCLPADVWVEMIPFDETRTYVRRVLFYTSVFDARLNQQVRPLRVALSAEHCLVNSAEIESTNASGS